MIDLDQARELLRRAMETQGREFVYNPEGRSECCYVPIPDIKGPQSQTGCLIGVALDLAGETRHHDPHNSRMIVEGLSGKYPDMMTGRAQIYFTLAQAEQDDGQPWGEAFDVAESMLSGQEKNG